MHERTDEELMLLVLDKYRPALEELYDRYVRLIYSFAIKSTHDEQNAREIVQLVFTRLWTTEGSYDSKKGRFVSWILTITRNITVDYLRKKKREERFVTITPEQWDEIPSLPQHCPETIVSRKLTKQQIQNAYQWLSESQVQLIQHVYWEGYSLTEVSQMRNEPLGTIKSRLHQSLKILREHLRIESEG